MKKTKKIFSIYSIIVLLFLSGVALYFQKQPESSWVQFKDHFWGIVLLFVFPIFLGFLIWIGYFIFGLIQGVFEEYHKKRIEGLTPQRSLVYVLGLLFMILIYIFIGIYSGISSR